MQRLVHAWGLQNRANGYRKVEVQDVEGLELVFKGAEKIVS